MRCSALSSDDKVRSTCSGPRTTMNARVGCSWMLGRTRPWPSASVRSLEQAGGPEKTPLGTSLILVPTSEHMETHPFPSVCTSTAMPESARTGKPGKSGPWGCKQFCPYKQEVTGSSQYRPSANRLPMLRSVFRIAAAPLDGGVEACWKPLSAQEVLVGRAPPVASGVNSGRPPSVQSRCNSSSRRSSGPKTDWCARGPHTPAGSWRVHRKLHSQPLGSRPTVDLIGPVLHDRGLLRDVGRIPSVRLMRSRLLPLGAVCCSLLAFPALGCASSSRAHRSVAGARATLVAYVAAVIAGDGTTACSLLTPAMAAQLAKADHQSSCETVIQIAAVLLKVAAERGGTTSVIRVNGESRGTRRHRDRAQSGRWRPDHADLHPSLLVPRELLKRRRARRRARLTILFVAKRWFDVGAGGPLPRRQSDRPVHGS